LGSALIRCGGMTKEYIRGTSKGRGEGLWGKIRETSGKALEAEKAGKKIAGRGQEIPDKRAYVKTTRINGDTTKTYHDRAQTSL